MAEYQATIYDDVWRTMVNDFPELLIAFVNELFATGYDDTCRVELLQDTHEQNRQDGVAEKRITDSFFRIISADGAVRHYHIECQSTPDDSMLVRMFEYGAQIALDTAYSGNNELVVSFPHAAVLFLRSGRCAPDRMRISVNTPGGSVSYEVKVAKMQSYTLEMLFYRRLLILLPFYMFIVENGLAERERDPVKLRELTASLESIVRQLDLLSELGVITAYTRKAIIELSNKVNQQLTRKYPAVQKEAEAVMHGHVLEYEAKTIYNKGITQGITQGEIKGKVYAIKAVMKNWQLSAEKAMEALGIPKSEYAKYLALL